MSDIKPIIEIKNLGTCFDGFWVHKNLNLTLYPNKINCIIGGSGCGKTTLMREILMLQPIAEGEIFLLGDNISSLESDEDKRRAYAAKMGMMFQQCALFSSLTVLENVMFPYKEYTKFTNTEMEELARMKLRMVGLDESAFEKSPSELSGGMLKRAALARTLALDPYIVFLDEPSAGLDPQACYELDQLILKLKNDLKLTIVMITHELESIRRIVDDIIYIDQKKILFHGGLEDAMQQTQYENLYKFFNGPAATHHNSPSQEIMHEK